MSDILRPIVTDEDRFVRCGDRDEILARGWSHRTVWGMVFSPNTAQWLVQLRREDKAICPGLWDMSCAGHVDCVDGQPEPYADAYAREMTEELGLRAQFLPYFDVADSHQHGSRVRVSAASPLVPTVSLGHSREYHRLATSYGERLVKEHVGMFLSICDDAVALVPGGEPQALAWMSTEAIRRRLIATGSTTPGLALMLDRCGEHLSSLGLSHVRPATES